MLNYVCRGKGAEWLSLNQHDVTVVRPGYVILSARGDIFLLKWTTKTLKLKHIARTYITRMIYYLSRATNLLQGTKGHHKNDRSVLLPVSSSLGQSRLGLQSVVYTNIVSMRCSTVSGLPIIQQIQRPCFSVFRLPKMIAKAVCCQLLADFPCPGVL